jgi:hypothetical protein
MEVLPAAKQVVALGHATPRNLTVLGIRWTMLPDASVVPKAAVIDTAIASTRATRAPNGAV